MLLAGIFVCVAQRDLLIHSTEYQELWLSPIVL